MSYEHALPPLSDNDREGLKVALSMVSATIQHTPFAATMFNGLTVEQQQRAVSALLSMAAAAISGLAKHMHTDPMDLCISLGLDLATEEFDDEGA